MNNLVSIVVPTYNVDKYIKDFIKDIIDQEYKNWELLLVDDGSDDRTIEFIKDYVEKDSRITLIERYAEPKGANTCRNIGLKSAKGEYIIFFDSDDLVQPYCLSQRVRFMNDNPSIDYAIFQGETVMVDQNRQVISSGRRWGINPNKDILKCFLSVNYPFGVWNNIYRKESLTFISWDEKLKIYMDFDFIVQCILKNLKYKFANSGHADYLYRKGVSGALTSNFIKDDKYESTKYLFEKTIKKLTNLSNSKEYLLSFEKFFELQFERVITSGTYEQSYDFQRFTDKFYSSLARRQKIVISMINKDLKKAPGDRKYRKILFIDKLVINPTWLLSYIIRKKNK